MYIKLIGSLLLFGSAITVGFLKAEELSQRVKNMQELKRMMSFLQGELRFHRALLSEAFENVGEKVGEPWKKFLKRIAFQLENEAEYDFETVWEKNSEWLLDEKGFQKEDRILLEMLKNGLGYLDLTMQTETLNLTMLRTEEVIMDAKEQAKTKGKLYRTMGVTMGALLVLLII